VTKDKPAEPTTPDSITQVFREAETIPAPAAVVEPVDGPVAMIADNPASIAPQVDSSSVLPADSAPADD